MLEPCLQYPGFFRLSFSGDRDMLFRASRGKSLLRRRTRPFGPDDETYQVPFLSLPPVYGSTSFFPRPLPAVVETGMLLPSCRLGAEGEIYFLEGNFSFLGNLLLLSQRAPWILASFIRGD